MAKPQRRVGYGLPLVLAIGLHLGLLIVSVIRFPSAEQEPPNQAIVQATLVRAETATDQAQQAQQQAQAAARAEQQRREAEAAEAERQAQEAQRQEQEAAQAAEREQAREAAEQAAAEAERRQREAEEQRQAEEEARRQREAEEQRQAEEEARRQREAEEQRQAEEEARRQREAEEQRQAEEEARRQREAEEQREREAAARRAAEAAQNSLDQAIAGESEAVANARQADEAANGFINLVRQAVEQAWSIPPNVPDGAAAEISVRLGPSGELFAANIGRSSGNSAFDRSALSAVETAAPFAELRELPASVQRQYREFNLRFRPGDIR